MHLYSYCDYIQLWRPRKTIKYAWADRLVSPSGHRAAVSSRERVSLRPHSVPFHCWEPTTAVSRDVCTGEWLKGDSGAITLKQGVVQEDRLSCIADFPSRQHPLADCVIMLKLTEVRLLRLFAGQ